MRRLAASLCLLAVAPIAMAQDRIDIRAHFLLPTDVQVALQRVAAERVLELPANRDPLAWLRSLCGGAITTAFQEEFRRLNEQQRPFEKITTPQPRTVPVCPQIGRNVAVPIRPGEFELAHPLRRGLGVALEHLLNVCDLPNGRCRRVTAEAWLRERLATPAPRPVLLVPGQHIDLPFYSVWRTVTLKPEFTAVDAVRILTEAMGTTDPRSRPMTVQEAPRLGLMRPLESGDEKLGNACAPALGVPQHWPFNREEVRSAILDGLVMLAERDGRGEGRPERTVIRIADTGIEQPQEVFGPGARFLARNPSASTRRDGFTGDLFGISPRGGGDLTPVGTADWRREHGAQVAEYALGGPGFRDGFEALAGIVGLNFARLFEVSNGGVEVHADMLAASFRVEPPEIHIVNMSVGGLDAITPLANSLDQAPLRRQLAVMAAGNDGRTLKIPAADSQYFPVSYRGEPRYMNHTLVVGAHAPPEIREVNGERIWHAAGAGFSNHGAALVDLLAPGCRLPDPFPRPGGSVLNGTSLAAPLVSFTAAILRSFLRHPAEPARIRERLAATIRWLDDPVAHETAFGGALDIAAALRVFDDVVRRRDGGLVAGHWILPDTVVRFCRSSDMEEEGDPVTELRVVDVARVRVEPRPSERPHLWVHVRTGVKDLDLAIGGCEAAFDGPTLLIDGKERLIPWSEIAAFTPAVSPTERRPHGSPPRPAVVSVANPPPAEVARALSSFGLVPTAPPGRPPTAAIREFQLRRGELPTGSLTAPQFDALRRAMR